MPDIVFIIDGTAYPIPPEDYILTVTGDGVEEPYVHADVD